MRFITFASIMLLIPLNAMASDKIFGNYNDEILGSLMATLSCKELKTSHSGLYENFTSSDEFKFMMKFIEEADNQNAKFSQNLDKIEAELQDIPDAFKCMIGASFVSGVNFTQIAQEQMSAN